MSYCVKNEYKLFLACEAEQVEDVSFHSSKERFLRLKEVIQRTGLSRSTIYLYISKGMFPKNVCIGYRCVGWMESDIDKWISSRVGNRK